MLGNLRFLLLEGICTTGRLWGLVGFTIPQQQTVIPRENPGNEERTVWLWIWEVCSFPLAAITSYIAHWMALNNRNRFSHSSGDQKSEITVLPWESFLESSSFWCLRCSLACDPVTPVSSSMVTWPSPLCLSFPVLSCKDTFHRI